MVNGHQRQAHGLQRDGQLRGPAAPAFKATRPTSKATRLQRNLESDSALPHEVDTSTIRSEAHQSDPDSPETVLALERSSGSTSQNTQNIEIVGLRRALYVSDGLGMTTAMAVSMLVAVDALRCMAIVSNVRDEFARSEEIAARRLTYFNLAFH